MSWDPPPQTERDLLSEILAEQKEQTTVLKDIISALNDIFAFQTREFR